MRTRIHINEEVLALLLIRFLVGFEADLFHEVLEEFHYCETHNELYLDIMKKFKKENHEIKTSNAIQI